MQVKTDDFIYPSLIQIIQNYKYERCIDKEVT